MSATEYELEARAMDWIVILSRLINRLDKGQQATRIEIENDTVDTAVAHFYLPKNVFTAQDIASTIGTTAEKVRKAEKKIVLLPLKGQADWQTPTVNYYGMA